MPDNVAVLLATALPPFPYPGLRPFEDTEWRIFFGREAMIDDVIELMAGRNLVFIHGSSGSGKSSLVRAGVLPKLAQMHFQHRSPWDYCKMRPEGGPLWNLAAAFAELEGAAGDVPRIGEIIGLFNQRGATLSDIVGQLRGLAGRRLCILVDQFEELFRFERETSREEAELFIELLIGEIPVRPEPLDDDEAEKPPAPAADGNVQIIITMRSEFLGDCARFDGFAEAINRAQYLVPRMTSKALTRAIRMPARLYGGEVRPALAERLIAEMRGRPDELPLIQHGLMQFWNEVAGKAKILDESLLESGGGLRDRLSSHAGRVMDGVATTPEREKAIKILFRALTDSTAEGQAVRRPQIFGDLIALCRLPEPDLREIVEAFRAEGASFLTPYAPKPIDHGSMIDISHEALIRCWDRLKDWIKAEAADAETYRALQMQAQDGQRLSGQKLRAAEAWWAAAGPTEIWARRYRGKLDGGFALTERCLASSKQRRLRRRALLIGGACVAVIAAIAASSPLYRLAFPARYADSQGDRYLLGQGVAQDYSNALQWYQKAAALGDAYAEFKIGDIYETAPPASGTATSKSGPSVTQDYGQAMFWYEKAADQGYADAEDSLGQMYENGEGVASDLTAAAGWFQKAAAQGNADAQNALGYFYEFGEGSLKTDIPAALSWFQKAAAQGNASAENNLGYLYQFSIGVAKDYKQALYWYEKGAAQGNAAAENDLGYMYQYGLGVPPSYQQAINWFKKAAAQGQAGAENSLGVLYEDGTGEPQDYKQAISWYKQSAAQGDASGEDDLGYMYQYGLGVTRNYQEAISLYQKAAAQGQADAENSLGYMYQYGLGVPRNYQEAISLYQKAAAQGYAKAENNLGFMYQYGLGMPQDYQQAISWLEKAAARGQADAENSLGVLYEDGTGEPQDYKQAISWYKQSAGQGDASGEYDLGYMYQYGLGVTRNYQEAISLYQKAAAQGMADAENSLGYMYQYGLGVPKDYKLAFSSYERAAAQGSASGENDLGTLYQDGTGVPQDDKQALDLYEKAAAQGNVGGEDNLADLYFTGTGVPQDYRQAAYWYQKATAQGDPTAEYELAALYLAGKGVPQDVAKARELMQKSAAAGFDDAKEWLAANPASTATAKAPSTAAGGPGRN